MLLYTFILYFSDNLHRALALSMFLGLRSLSRSLPIRSSLLFSNIFELIGTVLSGCTDAVGRLTEFYVGGNNRGGHRPSFDSASSNEQSNPAASSNSSSAVTSKDSNTGDDENNNNNNNMSISNPSQANGVMDLQSYLESDVSPSVSEGDIEHIFGPNPNISNRISTSVPTGRRQSLIAKSSNTLEKTKKS